METLMTKKKNEKNKQQLVTKFQEIQSKEYLNKRVEYTSKKGNYTKRQSTSRTQRRPRSSDEINNEHLKIMINRSTRANVSVSYFRLGIMFSLTLTQ